MPRCPTCHRRLARGGVCPADGSVASALGAGERELAGVPEDAVLRTPRIAGYRLEERVGYGGFASVYRARSEGDGALVALKIARSTDSVAAWRFAREAAMLRIIGAPHVPAVCERGMTETGHAFVAMAFIPKPTLATWMAACTEPPPVRLAVRVALAAARALQAVHQANIAHCDLKPENVLIDVDSGVDMATPSDVGPSATLIDFGLATRLLGPGAPAAETYPMGTPGYMAPEQIRGSGGLDRRTDVYAFGILLYEALALRLPFAGSGLDMNRGHVSLRVPRVARYRTVPVALERLLAACLAKDPAKRPSGMNEIRASLTAIARALVTGEAAMQTRIVPRTRTRTPTRQQQAMILLCGLPAIELGALDELVTGAGGFVARVHADSFVCAFSGSELQDPIGAAMRLTRKLRLRAVERLAIHIAQVRVRRGRDGQLRIYGTAVERPHTWLPTRSWRGVWVSRALTDLMPGVAGDRFSLTSPAGGSPADGSPTDSSNGESAIEPTIPFIGRWALVNELLKRLHQVNVDRLPDLVTLLAASGMGKTRLLQEMRARVVENWPQAIIIDLDATAHSANPRDLLIRLRRILTRELAAHALPPPGDGTTASLSRALHQLAGVQPVAVLVDDAHLADDRVLDVLEYATLDGVQAPVFVLMTARKRLVRMRTHWGTRARHHRQVTLAALESDDAVAMCAACLQPVEYVPAEVVERFATWTKGVPGAMVTLARTLRRDGVIRKRPGRKSWYIATAALNELSFSAVAEWALMREQKVWSREVNGFVQLCGCLGRAFFEREIDFVQARLEAAGVDANMLCPSVGLAALTEEGIFERQENGAYAFRSLLLQDASVSSLGGDERRLIHHHALEYWRERADRDQFSWRKLAHHAAAAGLSREAARYHRQLAQRAVRNHHYARADVHFSAELDALDERADIARAEALRERARMRCRMFRIADALGDIAAACELFQALGAVLPLAECWLEKATIHDWADEAQQAAECVTRARAIAATLVSSRLDARLLMAEGRALLRGQRARQAAAVCRDAARLARDVDDVETRVVALLIEGAALSYLVRAEEAERVFAEVIELCSATGDKHHLCAAYNNRMILWSFSGQIHRGVKDLRLATELARECGFPANERNSTFNLAELLFWMDEGAEALRLAERAVRLQTRFFGDMRADIGLLPVRIALAEDRREQASTALSRLVGRGLAESATDPVTWLLYRSVRLVLDRSAEKPDARPEEDARPDSWAQVLVDARSQLSGSELLEILFWRLRCPCQPEERASLLVEASALLAEQSIWQSRFASLRACKGNCS